jgi:twinkle protein
MRLGEITLFTSGTGSGKSTVVKETILNLLEQSDTKVGLISLEESIGDTATKLIGMSINKNIRMPDDVTEEEARKGYEKVFGDERLILLDHQGSVADTSLLDRIEYLAALGCSYLILDHITIAVSEGVDGATGNEAVDKVMSSLLKIVKRYNIHLTLISHLRKSSGEGKSFEEGIMPNLDSIKGSGSIKQISFDIIGFARNMMATEKSDRNIVKFAVLKSRFSGDTGQCGQAIYNVDTGRLNYNESNLAFEEVL